MKSFPTKSILLGAIAGVILGVIVLVLYLLITSSERTNITELAVNDELVDQVYFESTDSGLGVSIAETGSLNQKELLTYYNELTGLYRQKTDEGLIIGYLEEDFDTARTLIRANELTSAFSLLSTIEEALTAASVTDTNSAEDKNYQSQKPKPDLSGSDNDTVDDGSVVGVAPPVTKPSVSTCRAVPIPNSTVRGVSSEHISEIKPGLLYVVYAWLNQRQSSSQTWDSQPNETVNTYIIKGNNVNGKTEVWVTGGGYGDAGGPVYDIRRGLSESMTPTSEFVGYVNEVIQGCLGLSPQNVALRFIATHYHYDHVNPEFFDEIFYGGYGYDINYLKSYIHEADHSSLLGYAWPASMPEWDTKAYDSFESIGGKNDSCGEQVWSFSTAVGTWNVLANPGHTAGTINLMNNSLGYLITGAPFFGCSPTSAETYFHIHKNISWNDQPSIIPQR